MQDGEEEIVVSKKHLEKLVRDLEDIKTCAQYLERFFLDDYETTRKDSTAKSIAVQILEELETVKSITVQIIKEEGERTKAYWRNI